MPALRRPIRIRPAPAAGHVATHGHMERYHVAMSDRAEPQVGIRELKDNASALIRRVTAGEAITVTDRGRAVARIVPLRGEDDWWDRMADEGRLIPARRDLIEVLRENPAPPLLPGERSPFDVLMELRGDER